MKNIFLMFSVVLALLLTSGLAHGDLVDIDATPSEFVVADGEVAETATADSASNATDATINEGDTTIVVPGSEETDSEEATSEEAADEEASSDVGDPTDGAEDIGDDIGDGPVDANVPLPPALILMGSGLLGIGLLGWRRKKN